MEKYYALYINYTTQIFVYVVVVCIGRKLKVESIRFKIVQQNLSTMLSWERCKNCGRPLTNEANVKVIRHIFIALCGITAASLLLILGFTPAGVAARSFASGWQSTIGNVTAKSLFSILQSWGTSKLMMLLFGTMGAAVGLLISKAAELGFCKGNCENECVICFQDMSKDRRIAIIHLTIINIQKLISDESIHLESNDKFWKATISKKGQNFAILFSGNESCEIKMDVEIFSSNEAVKKSKIQDIKPDVGIGFDDLISWERLLDPENGFIQSKDSIEIEVRIEVLERKIVRTSMSNMTSLSILTTALYSWARPSSEKSSKPSTDKSVIALK